MNYIFALVGGGMISIMFFRSKCDLSKDSFCALFIFESPWVSSTVTLTDGLSQKPLLTGGWVTYLLAKWLFRKMCYLTDSFDKSSLISTNKIVSHSFAAHQTSGTQAHLFVAIRKLKQIPKNECWKCFDSLLCLSNCCCTRGLCKQDLK